MVTVLSPNHFGRLGSRRCRTRCGSRVQLVSDEMQAQQISIFDDRLKVESAGRLPFGLTVENLEHGVSAGR